MHNPEEWHQWANIMLKLNWEKKIQYSLSMKNENTTCICIFNPCFSVEHSRVYLQNSSPSNTDLIFFMSYKCEVMSKLTKYEPWLQLTANFLSISNWKAYLRGAYCIQILILFTSFPVITGKIFAGKWNKIYQIQKVTIWCSAYCQRVNKMIKLKMEGHWHVLLFQNL